MRGERETPVASRVGRDAARVSATMRKSRPLCLPRVPLIAPGSLFGPDCAALARFTGVAIVAGFALFALLLLAVRFVVFPRIESYRDTLIAALSTQLGNPSRSTRISTGWDGWNPKLVVTGLRVLDRARASELPLVELPEVDLVVAWTSLPLMELRVKELAIERPRLAIRRDRSGLLHVARHRNRSRAAR